MWVAMGLVLPAESERFLERAQSLLKHKHWGLNLKQGLHMLIFTLFLLFTAGASEAAVPWSKDAHDLLINIAFADERSDCLEQIKEGSSSVDSIENQNSDRAYLHAMRGPNQSVESAKNQAANYIQREYEIAADTYSGSTQTVSSTSENPLLQFTRDGKLITNINDYLASCLHRGRALHTVTDSTSPAHADRAIWRILSFHFFDHGDLPDTLEDEKHLLDNPDLKMKTIGLMHIVDRLYMEFGMKDFRFE